MKTQLFIENFEIELNDNVQFLLNKEFEHLSNPTDIINDWSKTVSIPFTEKNNKIFGYIYNPNRLIFSDGTDTGYTKMGIYFDPTKKLDFRLVYDSFVLMEGYAKMIDIKMTDYTGTYNITLNGQLGKIFQELKKITFDTTTEDTDYLIHGEDYVDEYIDRNLVYNSWTGQGQTHTNLMKKDNIYYNVNDIIGWAPNNSFSEGFDYKSYQVSSDTIQQFSSILGDSFKADTGIDADSVIPNGLLPREIGEYRSYLQLPFIYWNKLFQMFQAKAEEITGYKFDLDGTFFTPSNPDWYNLVYMLKSFSNEPVTLLSSNNIYYNQDVSRQWDIQATDYTTTYSWNITNDLTVKSQSSPIYDNNKFTIPTDQVLNIRHLFKWTLLNSNSSAAGRQIRDDNGLLTTITATGSNGYTQSEKFLIVTNIDTGLKVPGYKPIKIIDEGQTAHTVLNVIVPIDFAISTALFGDYVTFSVDYNWYKNSQPFANANSIVQLWLSDNIYIDTYKLYKTHSRFILNEIWNKDFNLFDEILRYCKIHRILIYTDDFERKIYFKSQKKYFENYSIEDWTSKLDRSKEIIIKPITFDNKYILFNYEDNNTQLGNEYRDKYGFDFGEYRLTTDYNFNTDTTDLFKGTKSKTSITNTDNVLSFINLSKHNIVYSFPNELFIYNKDKDNKQVDIFGTFYYHNGLSEFTTESTLGLIYPRISDDSNFQQTNNTYTYTAIQTDYSLVNTYPKLDIVYGDNLCLFNTPKENYTYLNNYDGKTSIYTRYWENYLNERYNIQNKVVTCYLTLTPKDWTDFRFNRFIKIDGVLYMVNKIYDYNIETPEPTKVDLITITDIKGYTE